MSRIDGGAATSGRGAAPPHAPQRPVFHPGYLRLLWALIENEGGDAASVLAAAGLHPRQLHDDAPLLPLADVRWLILAAERAAGRPTLALEAGAGVRLGNHGVLGDALAAAPDLRRAVALMVRHFPRRGGVVHITAEAQHGGLAYVVEPAIALGDVHRFVMEHIAASTSSLFSRIAASRLEQVVLDLPWPRPAWHAAYRRLCGEQRFDRPRLCFHLGDAVLDRPCPTADAAAFATASAACETLPDRTQELPDLAPLLRAWLDEAGAEGLSLAQAAQRLGLSSRTVIRRLRASGRTYQALVDDSRRERTLALLHGGVLPPDEIAVRLGLGSPANFARLCRRWFGMPPLEVRRHAPARRPDAA